MGFAYQRIADDLLRRIRAGEWRVGDQLPALNELERQYPQSRMTLYRALQHLAGRGYLSIMHGNGTFVKAMHIRQRIGILTGSAIFGPTASPFIYQVSRTAQAILAARGFDAQLYTEDNLTPNGMPTGLVAELEQAQFAGMLTIETGSLWYFIDKQAEKATPLPWVHIGSVHDVTRHARYLLYVDRIAFLEQALAISREEGRRRVLLLEREEHLSDDFQHFHQRCAHYGFAPSLHPHTMPSPALPYEDYGFEALQRVWMEPEHPDTVIVPDDVIAKGVAQAALALGIRVPDELRIIVLASRGVRIFYPLPITKLEVDTEALVTRAVEILLALIEGETMPPQTILAPPLPVETNQLIRA